MRYPSLKDGEAYVKVVLEYSGKQDFYKQIDLLFLLQWPQSKLRENGSYKDLKNYTEIVTALIKIYGSEETIKATIRYVPQEDILEHVIGAAIPDFDEQNLRDKLPLFSLAELLYRYVRCEAVHNADFPFINKCKNMEGNIEYRENHAITGEIFHETVEGIINNLRDECLKASKWPYEL
jgi:hypothetical protein